MSENKRRYSREEYSSGRRAEWYANQLERGDQIAHKNNHHEGMRALKRRQGHAQPSGTELSLVEFWGPTTYWGYTIASGERIPYRLDTDPDNYTWETKAQNRARQESTESEYEG